MIFYNRRFEGPDENPAEHSHDVGGRVLLQWDDQMRCIVAKAEPGSPFFFACVSANTLP